MSNSVAVWIPMYNSARALDKVFDDILSVNWNENVHFFFLDNLSDDDSIDIAIHYIQKSGMPNAKVLRNSRNVGLGGSQKTAFAMSEQLGFKNVAIFHSDYQPSATDLLKLIQLNDKVESSCVLGARFMAQSSRYGYGKARFFGNILLNTLYSIRFFKPIYDLGSGLNVYKLSEMVEYRDLPNDLSFNCNLLTRIIRVGMKVHWQPITWREGLAPSSLKMFSLGFQSLRPLVRINSKLQNELINTAEVLYE